MYRGAAFVAVAGVSVTLQGCGGGTSSYELECKDSCKATVSCDDKKGFVSKPTGCKGSLDLVNPTDCPKFLDELKKDDDERKKMCVLLEATPVDVNTKYICSDTCTVEIHCEKDSGNFKADGKGAGCVKKPTFAPKTFQECEKAVAKYDSDADAKNAMCDEVLGKAPQATKDLVIDCGDACVSKLMCDEHGAPSFLKGQFCLKEPDFKPAPGKCVEQLDKYKDEAKRTEMCKAMGTKGLSDLEYLAKCDDTCQVEIVCSAKGAEYVKVVDTSCPGDIPKDLMKETQQECADLVAEVKKDETLRNGFCKTIKDGVTPTEEHGDHESSLEVDCGAKCRFTMHCKNKGEDVTGVTSAECPKQWDGTIRDPNIEGCKKYVELLSDENSEYRTNLCEAFKGEAALIF